MENQLTIKKTEAYEIIAPVDEYKNGSYGIYKSGMLASVDAKNCGWYGAPGKVNTLDDVYTDGKNVYRLEKIEFKDVKRKVTQEMNDSIKSKLSEEEIEFLKSNDLK